MKLITGKNSFLAVFVILLATSESLAQKYRVVLPPRPQQPPALNNTVQSQIANQNIGFNTSNSISMYGGVAGGFNANSGGIQGTAQYTQNNAPGSQLSFLYQLPTAMQFQQGGGGFGQGGGGVQAIGMNNPFYSMAMQGIMAGVGVSAFQSGGQFGGGQFGGGQFGGGQFGGGQFCGGQV